MGGYDLFNSARSTDEPIFFQMGTTRFLSSDVKQKIPGFTAATAREIGLEGALPYADRAGALKCDKGVHLVARL
jgi:hypothetical protein